MGSKRNKTLLDMLLLENNQRRDGTSACIAQLFLITC